MTTLSALITNVAAKRLSSVETNPTVSNQHEFQGIKEMVEIFGAEKRVFECMFLYLGDDEEETASSTGTLTWYDSRLNQPHRSAEYRFYYPGNAVTELASAGDLLIIAQKSDESLLALVVKQGSTVEHQVLWLFGLDSGSGRFTFSRISGKQDREIGFAERTILKTLGVEAEIEPQENWLEKIVERFKWTFPATKAFAAFTRDTVMISALDDPDLALITWINQEEMLFRTLEKFIVEKRLKSGFQNVDDFIAFSLSVHNRRKSRMGFALENHLEHVFDVHNLSYTSQCITENKIKVDFMFPSAESYHNNEFPTERLTMLGSKSTCKDRWRQVLTEAARIPFKHLFTLEPGISKNQTDEMQAHNLQLVLPSNLHISFSEEQQSWLMNLTDFIKVVRERQL